VRFSSRVRLFFCCFFVVCLVSFLYLCLSSSGFVGLLFGGRSLLFFLMAAFSSPFVLGVLLGAGVPASLAVSASRLVSFSGCSVSSCGSCSRGFGLSAGSFRGRRRVRRCAFALVALLRAVGFAGAGVRFWSPSVGGGVSVFF
jgi:hypothetical protein